MVANGRYSVTILNEKQLFNPVENIGNSDTTKTLTLIFKPLKVGQSFEINQTGATWTTD